MKRCDVSLSCLQNNAGGHFTNFMKRLTLRWSGLTPAWVHHIPCQNYNLVLTSLLILHLANAHGKVADKGPCPQGPPMHVRETWLGLLALGCWLAQRLFGEWANCPAPVLFYLMQLFSHNMWRMDIMKICAWVSNIFAPKNSFNSIFHRLWSIFARVCILQ